MLVDKLSQEVCETLQITSWRVFRGVFNVDVGDAPCMRV